MKRLCGALKEGLTTLGDDVPLAMCVGKAKIGDRDKMDAFRRMAKI
jgi:hypothetical protein